MAAGTPLKAAPFLTPSHIAELNQMRIVTVEQLANLPDTAMGFMGAQEFKQAAKRYLDSVSGSEALLKRIEALEKRAAAAEAARPRLTQAGRGADAKVPFKPSAAKETRACRPTR